MKKLFLVSIIILLFNYSFGQNITTLLKLHDVSIVLGIANITPIDTLLNKSNIENYKIAEQQLYLLRAAEYYLNKDYENSGFYIKKVAINFKSIDYNNLKYVVLIGSYAKLKDIKETARYFYIINKSKPVDPENMNLIRSLIGDNFKKDDFDKALAHFYYYHDRLKLINEIKFEE
jgi:hypothetical protein